MGQMMLFLLVHLIVPLGMAAEVVWTIKRGRLPSLRLLPGVTRQGMPVPFWLYVGCLSLATVLVTVISAAFVLASL